MAALKPGSPSPKRVSGNREVAGLCPEIKEADENQHALCG